MKKPNNESSGEEDGEKKETKVTLFGILAATKALTNPIKESLEIQKQQLQVSDRIDKHLEIIANVQKALADNILRVANAIETNKQ